MRRFLGTLFIAFFSLVCFALVWTVPYAAVTGYRSGITDRAKKWDLLVKVTTENPAWDMANIPPVSLQKGFPLAFRHAYVFGSDPRFRSRVFENAAIAAGVILALIAGLALFFFLNRRSTLHGDARFGTVRDAIKAGLLAKDGLILGKLGGRTLRSNDPAHILVVGPTRSGKGVSFVIPNGLSWKGSIVVLDIKMENHNAFGQARKKMGHDVFVFAPGSVKTHRYNPLDFVRPGPEMATDCQNIAGFLAASHTENEWTLAARKIIAALLGYVLTSELCADQRNIRSAVNLISTGQDMADVLKSIVETERADLPQWVLDDFNQFIAIPDRTRGSVMFNVANAFAPWSSELITQATSGSDFDIRLLRKKPMAIFIGTPLADLESYRPLVRILFQQIHDLLMRSLPGRDEPHRVLLLLDEFFALGKMTSLASKIAVSAGYGFRMAIILQNLSQLDELYGKATRETLVAGAALKLFVAINDNATAEYVSEALGNYTTDNRTQIVGTGITQSARVSVTKIGVPLKRPEELMRMAREKSLLLVANGRPLEVEKVMRFIGR
jgi:type IV secretion system protein VirD4